MGAPSQAEILAKITGANNTPPATPPEDELEVEEEEVESTEAAGDATGTEVVEQVDADAEAETGAQEEVETADEEIEDEDQFLDYTASGQAQRVNLRDPADLARVKTALEKQGLERTVQVHAEGRKRAEQEAEALRVKLSEYQAMEEQRRPLDPYLDLLKNPQARQAIQRQFRLPAAAVDYDPQRAQMAAENARLKAAQATADRDRDLRELESKIIDDYKMTGEQLGLCIEYLNDRKLGANPRLPIKEQADSIHGLIGMARSALVQEGKIPNPEVERLQKEKAEADRRLVSAKKRAKARPSSAGTGAIAAQAGKTGTDLAGADTSTLVAEFKRRSGK